MASKEDKTFWDALMAACEKQRENFAFEMAENGYMEETHDSLKRRIHAKWGFDPARVVPMEADSCAPFELGGMRHYACAGVRFTVCGVGWATDFETIERAPEWDDEEEGGEE